MASGCLEELSGDRAARCSCRSSSGAFRSWLQSRLQVFQAILVIAGRLATCSESFLASEFSSLPTAATDQPANCVNWQGVEASQDFSPQGAIGMLSLFCEPLLKVPHVFAVELEVPSCCTWQNSFMSPSAN